MATIQFNTIVNDNEVVFTFKTGIENHSYMADFKVNGSHDLDPNLSKKDKYLITKWLLDVWKSFITSNTFEWVYCIPYKEDGEKEYRTKAYKKLGFIPVLRTGYLGYFSESFISQEENIYTEVF